jgi:hypothetical protein
MVELGVRGRSMREEPGVGVPVFVWCDVVWYFY